MPSRASKERVYRRLQELYQRHQRIDLNDIANYYEPGSGYCAVDVNTATHEPFAIALATTDGDLQSVGDDELAFALQSVSKVFTYARARGSRTRARPRTGWGGAQWRRFQLDRLR